MGIFLSIFNLLLLGISWLFAFKYYVISTEVPKFIKGERIDENTEKKHMIINGIGLLINSAVAIA